MPRFYLPFATGEETIIRSTSFFLLRQYFEYRNGNISDINLKGMDEYYREIQLVNAGMLARINAITPKDADSNAIIILNSLAELLVIACENSLDFVKKFLLTAYQNFTACLDLLIPWITGWKQKMRWR